MKRSDSVVLGLSRIPLLPLAPKALAAVTFLTALTAAAPAQAITRCSAIEDAANWVANHVPYSQSACWHDPLRDNECYRTDCSGMVSANWDLGPPGKTTLNFHNMEVNKEIGWSELLPGDALVYRLNGSGHIMLFKSFASSDGFLWVYEEPGTGKFAQYVQKSISTLKSKGYHPIRYNNIEECEDPPPPIDKKAVIELGVEVEDIDGQPNDFPPSDDVFDMVVGQKTTIHILVSNSTNSNVPGGHPEGVVALTSPDFAIREWHIYDNHECATEWCINDADSLSTNPPHTNPPNDSLFYLNAISPGETKRLDLVVEAMVATQNTHPELRFFIKHVDDFYEKTAYDAAPNNVGGFQTFNGGDLKFRVPLDIKASLPAIPTGVRRPIADMQSWGEWKFEGFFTVPDNKITSIPLGIGLPAAPELVKADDGSPEIWVVDTGLRRHIPSTTVAGAWQFDLSEAKAKPKATIEALPRGPDLRAYPFLVKGTADTIYVLDDPLDSDGGLATDSGITKDSGGADTASSKDGAAGSVNVNDLFSPNDESGCQCRQSTPRTPQRLWGLLLLVAVAIVGRRPGRGYRLQAPGFRLRKS